MAYGCSTPNEHKWNRVHVPAARCRAAAPRPPAPALDGEAFDGAADAAEAAKKCAVEHGYRRRVSEPKRMLLCFC
eukprot:gene16410-biopygen2888